MIYVEIEMSSFQNGSDNTSLIIEAQPNLNSKEEEYRNIGRQLTKIIYNKDIVDQFKSSGGKKTIIIQMPIIEFKNGQKSYTNSLISTLRSYIIDIAMQAKKNGIQIDIRE